MNNNKIGALILSGLTAVSLTHAKEATSNKKPNLVLVFVDDMGWGTFSPNIVNFTKDDLNKEFISKHVKDYTIEEAFDAAKRAMPNIEKYTNEGVRFTNAYVTANVSAPSRAGMLTSSYQERYGLYIIPDAEKGLPDNILYMPQVLKSAGYTNGFFGKHHNGGEKIDELHTCTQGQHPLDRGFDSFFGFNYHSTEYYNSGILFQNKRHVECSEYLTDKLTEEAVKFIGDNKGKPKLVYLPYNALHAPLNAPAPSKYTQRFQYASKSLNTYASYTAAIDDGIAVVMQKMKDIGELDNTVLIFMADNGAPGNGQATLPKNGPFTGFKGQDFQGGFRVPMFIWYGNKIKQGLVCNQVVSSMDIFPTFFDIANVELPKNQKVDGISLVPLIQGKSSKEVHESLVFMSQHAENWGMNGIKDQSICKGSFMVRKGDYVLRFIPDSNAFYLNDLSNDRAEKVNLITKYPQKAEEMKIIFRNWFSEMKTPNEWKPQLWQVVKFWDKTIMSTSSVKNTQFIDKKTLNKQKREKRENMKINKVEFSN